MQELTKEGFDIVVSCANYERIKEMKNIDRSGEKENFIQWFWMHPFSRNVYNFRAVFKLMMYLKFDHAQLVDK
jgi:hypothetical protein